MTGVPEVTLAAEAGLRYAAISLVVNPASGVGDSDEPITMEEIDAVLTTSAADVLAVLDELVHTRATFPTTRARPRHDRGSASRTPPTSSPSTTPTTVLRDATVTVEDGVITAIERDRTERGPNAGGRARPSSTPGASW